MDIFSINIVCVHFWKSSSFQKGGNSFLQEKHLSRSNSLCRLRKMYIHFFNKETNWAHKKDYGQDPLKMAPFIFLWMRYDNLSLKRPLCCPGAFRASLSQTSTHEEFDAIFTKETKGVTSTTTYGIWSQITHEIYGWKPSCMLDIMSLAETVLHIFCIFTMHNVKVRGGAYLTQFSTVLLKS